MGWKNTAAATLESPSHFAAQRCIFPRVTLVISTVFSTFPALFLFLVIVFLKSLGHEELA